MRVRKSRPAANQPLAPPLVADSMPPSVTTDPAHAAPDPPISPVATHSASPATTSVHKPALQALV